MRCHIKRTYGALILSFMLIVSTNVSAEPEYSDAMVRAAVIFGILRFTDWPVKKRDNDSVRLCLYGNSPSGSAIAKLDKIPSIGRKTVTVTTNPPLANINNCHAVIVGHDAPVLQNITDSVLLICDECDQTESEVFAIHLLIKENRIQFAINLDRTQEQQINLSASLIELAASCSSSNPNIKACDD
jgi:uncharacterized protein DUF4154